MKHSKTSLAVWFLCFSALTTTLAQSSLNVVGYYTVMLQPGDNLIANQLIQTNNSLNNILVGGVLAGSTFTQWDPVHNQFLPPSVFDGHSWSINYNWNPVDGMGAVIHSPGPPTNNVFVGEVYMSPLPGHGIDEPLLGYWDGPSRGAGVFLLADQVPITSSFTMVVGRDPVDGESVKTLDPLTQVYSVTTFHQGIGWDNGVPSLAVGQAAFSRSWFPSRRSLHWLL